MLKQHRKLIIFGKTAKINIEERTPKFLYRTEVNNVSGKCIPYIYYTLAKKWVLVVVENVACTIYTDGRGWRCNE